jgi:hypothetical protein
MIIPEPVTLSDVDEYIEDLRAIADKAKRALSCGLRARMAVSAGAQKVAYSYLAKVGILLMEIYQAGCGSEADFCRKYSRSNPTHAVAAVTADPIEAKPKRATKNKPKMNRRVSRDKG